MSELTRMTALELARLIRTREVTVAEAVGAQLERIRLKEPTHKAYISVVEEEAYHQANEVQNRIDLGELVDSPLAGVPFAVKDNICTKGIKTSCGSKMLDNFIPTYDATVMERLKAAGAVMIGKTNMDEFAMGSTTETSYYGETRNPWDVSRAPGGSSGGSAAAVASGEAFYALGSDTGGSIRQPAGYCGITGIKPTYGTVSRYGLIAYASSLDQIGTLGKDVSDCTAALEIISGYDNKDSTSVKQERYNYRGALVGDVRGLRIGMPTDYLIDGLEPEVEEHIRKAAEIYKSQGALVEEFKLDGVAYAVPSYYVLACAEASSNLSRYDGMRYGYRAMEEGLEAAYKKSRSEGFGEEVKRRLMIGGYVLSSGYYDALYKKALKVRAVINKGFMRAFEKYDVIMGPTAPQTAPSLGVSLSDPLRMYLSDIYTVSANLAGLPAISIPCGRDKAGLPIGLQLIGKHFGERDIIRAAYSFEQVMPLLSEGRDGDEAI